MHTLRQNQDRKLTVAIPTYNRKEYLSECLHSLSLQSYKNFQVIIFDNASNYDVNHFIAIFPELKIQIDKNDTNIGNHANFQKIIKYDFKHSYVMMFHDDDTLHPFYIEDSIAFLDTHPQAVWAGSNIRFVKDDAKGEMGCFDMRSRKKFKEINGRELVNHLMKGFNLGFGSIVYRSHVLKKAVSRLEEFDKWLDRPLMIDLVEEKTVGVTYGKYMNYRIHKNQDSQEKDISKLEKLVNLMNYFRNKAAPKDMALFYTWASNSSINASTEYSANIKEFQKNLQIFKDAGLFSPRNIGLKGVYYFLRFLLKQKTLNK